MKSFLIVSLAVCLGLCVSYLIDRNDTDLIDENDANSAQLKASVTKKNNILTPLMLKKKTIIQTAYQPTIKKIT